MKARGGMVRNPWKEAFLSPNIKFILVAIVVLLGQGVVWYSGQFWPLLPADGEKARRADLQLHRRRCAAHRLPTLILFGWLSDNIGRKPVILGGMFLQR